jgi:hypothetical protein
VLIVAYAPDSADTFSAFPRDSITALEWLQQACDSARIRLEVEQYPFGELVVQIGGKRNGGGGNWLYQVNGQMVSKSASRQRVSSGDSVLFYFE